jgi:hypothetical protein
MFHADPLDQLKVEEIMAAETINDGLKVIYGLLCDCFAISFCLREANKTNVFHFTQRFVDHKEFILTIYLVLLLFSRNQSTSQNTALQRLSGQRMRTRMRKTMMRRRTRKMMIKLVLVKE